MMRLVSIGFVALALCSTGCSVADLPASYDGDWQGSWSLSDQSATGALSMTLGHDGQHISGTVSVGGTLCIGSASMEATVGAGGLSGEFTNGVGGAVDIDGEVDGAGDFSGTFTVKSGLCTGQHGTFDMHH
jgi:hypothetical protein